MEIKLGNKIYILPEPKELNPDQNWKIVRLARKIKDLEEKASDIYGREKENDFASACKNYVTINVTLAEITSKLHELLNEVEKLEIEEELKRAKIEQPRDNKDEQYNQMLGNVNQVYTDTMGQLNNGARDFRDMAQSSLQTVSNIIGIETPQRQTPESETPKAYTLDNILKEYENIAPNKNYTQQEQKDIDDMISKFEEYRRNSNLMDEKGHNIAEELTGNFGVIHNRYKDTGVLENKGIFAKIRNFFGRNSSLEKLEKKSRKNKGNKIKDIVSDIKKGFSSKSRKKKSKEEIVDEYKNRFKGAIAASLAILGIQVGIVKEIGAEPIDETLPSKSSIGEFSTDAINEVADIGIKNSPNNMVEFEKPIIDAEKIDIAIKKNIALYQEAKNLVGAYNKSVTAEQCKSVINKFDEINSKNISVEDKKQKLNEYLATNDDVLTAEEKQQTVLEIKKSIDNEINNEAEKDNQIIVDVPVQEEKVAKTTEFDWDTIKAIVEEKNAQTDAELKQQEDISGQEDKSQQEETKNEEISAKAKEVREKLELIDKIFEDISMPDSARENTLKLNLKGTIDEDYVHDIMKNEDLSDGQKQQQLKNKILRDYQETMVDDELKNDYNIINSVMEDKSIPNDDITKSVLTQNLKYADENSIGNIVGAPVLTNEQKGYYLKQIVNNNYELSTLDEDVKKGYDMVDSIMNDRSMPNGQRKSTVVNNLKEYIPERTINEIFNKYELMGMNNQNISQESINEIIEYELKSQIVKLKDRKGYEDIYSAVEDTVGRVPSDKIENALYTKLSSIDDMKVAIDEGDIDLKDLASQINQSKEPSYVIVDKVGEKLTQVRKDNELSEQEEELKDILEKNLGSATVEELEDKIDDMYPLDDMKAIGFLQENDIKNIVNNENLSKKEKTRQIMQKVTTANEQYDKLGFGKQKDKTDEYER